MNRYRALTVLSVCLSIIGIIFMGTSQSTIGTAAMAVGLGLALIFLRKARREEACGTLCKADRRVGAIHDVVVRRQKKTVLQWLRDKGKKLPATAEEVSQLELEYEKARLEAGIERFKAEKRRLKGSSNVLDKLFGPMDPDLGGGQRK